MLRLFASGGRAVRVVRTVERRVQGTLRQRDIGRAAGRKSLARNGWLINKGRFSRLRARGVCYCGGNPKLAGHQVADNVTPNSHSRFPFEPNRRQLV